MAATAEEWKGDREVRVRRVLLLLLEGFLWAASVRKAGGDGGEAQDAGSGPPEKVGLNHTKEVERRTSGEAGCEH